MDMPRTPFVAPGGVDRPYPSYWDYTQRDYGNRVGIYRLMRVLDQRGLRATALLNGAVATRYPALAAEIAASQWEVAAAGVDMGRLHHGGLPEAEERALVKQAVGALRGAFASKIRGWHSPAHSESMRTLDLVAEAGLDYVADWINDDMPYSVTTSAGKLTAMPLAWDLSDQRLLFQQHMDTAEFVEQVLRAFKTLYAEAGQDGQRPDPHAHHHPVVDGPAASHPGAGRAARPNPRVCRCLARHRRGDRRRLARERVIGQD